MSHFFQNREGQTPLEESMRFDLKLKHIQDMTELYEIESEHIAEAIVWCESTHKNHLEYPTWLELHKQMLGKIWKFAGNIRSTELANDDFHLPYNIRPSLLLMEKDLKYWIEHKTYPPKEMMAIFHEKLLTIHPFKDGNGRWSRVLTEFICMKENIEVPNWGASIKDDKLRRDTYIKAIIETRRNLANDKLIHFMWD
jgi:fido (protein-threonine AMPylation protein)